jgi:transposase
MRRHNIRLKGSDKEELEQLLKRGKLPVRVQKRALGLLELDRGKTYQSVAETLSVRNATVHSWGKKYMAEGLSSILDKPRSGRPLEKGGELCAKITALACSTPPEGYAKWSLRLLADKVVELNYTEKISHTEVGRILKKMNCSLTASDNGV